MNEVSLSDKVLLLTNSNQYYYADTSSDFTFLFPLLQKKIKKEEYLLKEGEVRRHVYFLLNGFFRMYYMDEVRDDISYRFTGKIVFLLTFKVFIPYIHCVITGRNAKF